MQEIVPESRRFAVRARHLDRHHAGIVLEPSFEAAAIAYVERCLAPTDGDPALGIVVLDLDSGLEHCFRIDLDSGVIESC